MVWNLPTKTGYEGELNTLAKKNPDFLNEILGEYNVDKGDLVEGGTWMNPEGTVVDETKSQQGQRIYDEDDETKSQRGQRIYDADKDHTYGIEPATPPKWYKPWTYMWNRGGIASTRPGYRFGGFGKQKEDPVHGYVWG